jgi:geranylgeranyl pyrophosphate synthase
MKTEAACISYINEKSHLIENKLAELVSEKGLPFNSLFEAGRYSLLAGGKRLRPILTLATAEVFGIQNQAAIQPACALEMIHTYSLIHDDLPCMDDDDFRRGKPSLHKAFKEDLAVLTGDFLLTYAFEILSTAPFLSADIKIALVQVLAENAGAFGMIGGQVMDIEAESKSININYLQSIHLHKTGALITAAILFGGLLGKATSEELETLKSFGFELGLAFQMIDDVLDVTSEKNSDAKNGKTTYVSLLGIEATRELAHKHYQKALESLSLLNKDTTLLKDLAALFVLRDK